MWAANIFVARLWLSKASRGRHPRLATGPEQAEDRIERGTDL
jgi:hypothetical protein